MLEFDAEKHEYTLDGKALISVTQLMKKHGLAPDYSAVPEDVLSKKARRGTLIHKEIEEWCKEGKEGFTDEAAAFARYAIENGVRIVASEVTLHNDVVAGTCDLILNYGDGAYTIADVKTTSTLHRDAVSWQLSIYAALTGMAEIVRGQAIWFGPEGMKAVDIPLKPKEEVERLFECERKGIPYQQTIPISEARLALLTEAELVIKRAKVELEAAQRQAQEIKDAVLKAMEEHGVKRFENEEVSVTYVPAYSKESIDAKRLREESPETYERYKKQSEVQASVRITLKLKERKNEQSDADGQA